MAYCAACGKQLSSPIFRTREAKCYVFRGAADDPRNGILLHTRDGVRLASNEMSVVIPAMSEQSWQGEGWKPPEHDTK